MRTLWIGVACVAAGCGPRQPAAGPAPESAETTTTVTRTLSLGRVVSADPTTLDRFRPAVPAFGDSIDCHALDEEGERLVLVAFENGPGGAVRNVVLRFTAAGTLRHYSDIRGDLTGGSGDRTSISADMERGRVFAMNESASIPAIAEGTWDAGKDLPNLGAPAAMIERITRQCGVGH